MKLKIALLGFLLILPLGLQAKDKIAVFPFINRVSDDTGITKMAENGAIDLLVSQKRFDVMERAQLDQLIQEQKLQTGGFIDADQAVAIGKLGGIKYAVLGEIVTASFERVPSKDDKTGKVTYSNRGALVLQMRIIDVESGQVIYSDTFKRPGSGVLGIRIYPSGSKAEVFNKWLVDIIRDDVQKNLEKVFPLSGVVAMVENNGKTVIIDLGSEAGVSKKMSFDVVVEEKKLVAATQKTITIVRNIGRVEVKEVSADSSVAEVKDGRDAIKEGMKIVSKKD